MNPSPELIAAVEAAREADRAADEALAKALQNYRTTVFQLYKAELACIVGNQDDKAYRIARLVGIVGACGASWSGGPAGSSNLRETIRREVAIHLLRSEYHHV